MDMTNKSNSQFMMGQAIEKNSMESREIKENIN